MRKQSIYTLLFFLSLVVFQNACTKNENVDSSADFIEFGHFHGFCFGESCIEIFRLDAKNIYEDTTDVYPSGTLMGISSISNSLRKIVFRIFTYKFITTMKNDLFALILIFEFLSKRAQN